MSADGPRTSVFTFQSAVHSHHVLRSLDELRQKELLCDLKVEVESRSFRAHSSVLASCSDYFYTRLANHSRPNIAVRLPDEVTVEGFEPLLQFAYTAKLYFTKENILEIHRCAKLLGFHNLDKSCFEFLIPKLSDGKTATIEEEQKDENQSSHEISQAVCGNNSTTGDQNLDTGKDDVPRDAEAEQTACAASSTDCPSISHDKEIQLDLSPLYAKGTSYHIGEGQDQFCLQNCGLQLSSASLAPGEVCPFLSISNTGDNEKLHSATAGCGGDILAMEEELQKELVMDVNCVSAEPSTDKDLNVPSITNSHFVQHQGDLIPPDDCSHLCPLNLTESRSVLESIANAGNLSNIGADGNQVFDSTDLVPKDGIEERSTVEREVAEHLAKGFWPDLSSTLTDPLPLESIGQSAGSNNSDFHWLKHLDLGAAPDDCPFLRDLSSNEGQSSGGDNLSREDTGDSSCISPINSENSGCESDEDCEQCDSNDPAQEVDLPFPVEQISSMTRRAFLQMLKQQRLTPEQLEFVQDVRRRSKNRVAAQRCRKRKLDCIYRLEGDIKKLRSEKDKLLQDRNQLKFSMEELHQNLSGLRQSLGLDASPQSEQLQALARYISSDCPTSVLLTPMASPSLAGPDREGQANSCLDAFLTEELSDSAAENTAAFDSSSVFLQDSVQIAVTQPSAPEERGL